MVNSVPPIRRRVFIRQVRGLDHDAFGRFVADLWASRGWETRRDGDLITADRGAMGSGRQVLCLESTTQTNAASDQHRYDAVVTRSRRPNVADSRVRVITVDDLYETALYGIDRTSLDTLCQRHFGAPASALGGEITAIRPARLFEALADRVGSKSTLRATGLVLLAAALLIASGSAVVFNAGQGAPSDGENSANAPAVTPLPSATASPTPVPIRAQEVATRPTCAQPPIDASPAELRPGVISHASSHGLEGWEIRSEQTISNFPGPNAVPTPQVPEVKYLGAYIDPKGRYYRVDISRWESPNEATLVADTMADVYATWVPWGRYTIAISAFDRNGTAISDASTAANTRMLLAGVERADGPKIGEACVRRLLNRDDQAAPTA